MRHRIIALYIFLLGLLGVLAFAYMNYKQNTDSILKNNVAELSSRLSSDDVEQIVDRYLEKNPEVIVKSLENYQKRQEDVRTEKATHAIQQNAEALYRNADDPRVGHGKIKIVAFFDYGCGFCKRMASTEAKMIKENNNIEYIFKEMPILGQASTLASKAALSVYKIDSTKYFSFHQALLTFKGIITESKIYDLVHKLNIDAEQFNRVFESKEIAEIIQNNYSIAQKIGIRGTPALIIGGQLIPGAMSYEEISSRIQSLERNIGIKEGAKKTSDKTSEKYQDAKEGIKEGAKKTSDKASEKYQDAKEGIKEGAKKTSDKTSEKYQDAKEGIKEGAKKTSDKASEEYQDTKESIKEKQQGTKEYKGADQNRESTEKDSL